MFTHEQVKNLNDYQDSGIFHPFTCGKCGADLRATEEGWVCDTEGCDYTQNWAHAFMLDGGWRKYDWRWISPKKSAWIRLYSGVMKLSEYEMYHEPGPLVDWFFGRGEVADEEREEFLRWLRELPLGIVKEIPNREDKIVRIEEETRE